MPNATEMREILTRYLQYVGRRDVDAVLELLADDVLVEDPVGGAPGTQVKGRDAVGAFFREGFARSKPAPTLTGPIRTTPGNEAAMPFTLRLELSGRTREFDIIDAVEFDAQGKITRLRAFWNPEEMRTVD